MTPEAFRDRASYLADFLRRQAGHTQWRDSFLEAAAMLERLVKVEVAARDHLQAQMEAEHARDAFGESMPHLRALHAALVGVLGDRA